MNGLLWGVSAYQNYRIGKSTGAAGIVGIILTIVCIANWNEYIYPILEFFRFDDLLKAVGLWNEDPWITAFNVFWVSGVISIITCALGTMIFTVFLPFMTETSFGRFLSSAIFFLILSPFIIVFVTIMISWLIWHIMAKHYIPEKLNPEAYHEQQRLAKNVELIEPLRTADEFAKVFDVTKEQINLSPYFYSSDKLIVPKEPNTEEGYDNIVSPEQARELLDRLPNENDFSFMLALTKARDFYLLVPSCMNTLPVNSFRAFKASFLKKRFVENQQSTGFMKATYDEIYKIVGFMIDESITFKGDWSNRAGFLSDTIHDDDIEYIFDLRHNRPYMILCEYIHNCDTYKKYVMNTRRQYFYSKEKAVDAMNSATTSEDYLVAQEEYAKYNAANEAYSRLMLDLAIEEEKKREQEGVLGEIARRQNRETEEYIGRLGKI